MLFKSLLEICVHSQEGFRNSFVAPVRLYKLFMVPTYIVLEKQLKVTQEGLWKYVKILDLFARGTINIYI